MGSVYWEDRYVLSRDQIMKELWRRDLIEQVPIFLESRCMVAIEVRHIKKRW